MAATNPLRVTYPASATGAQTALSIDWRDQVPSGYSYEVQFNAGASGSVTLESTLDDINDASITPDWIAETGAITADTRGVIGHPVVATRLNISSLAGGTITLKLLGGSIIGDASGVVPSGGGTPTANVDLVEVGGTAISLGQKAMAASLPVVLASDQSGIIGVAYSAPLTITRPANQTPYSINDVVGGALTFPSMGPSAGRIMLTSTQLELDISSIPSGMTSFFLALYSVTPPSALADNAPWDLPSGDRASFLGLVQLGTPIDLGSTLYVEQNIINKQIKLAGTSLFGYLVTATAYTPAANSEVYVATLHSVGLGL